MDRGGGGVGNTADDAVVVIQRDALASLDLKTSRACAGENDSQQGRGVLILDDDADSSFGSRSGGKGCDGRSTDGGFRVRKVTDERRREGDISHVSKFLSC